MVLLGMGYCIGIGSAVLLLRHTGKASRHARMDARYGRGGYCIDVKGAAQLMGTFVVAYATV